VNTLHLPSGKPTFDVQIKSDEREGQGDRLGPLVSVLQRPSIHHVLMDEGRITKPERICLQFTVGLKLAIHPVSSQQ